MGNSKDHIFYVICGAGKHSENHKAVLKYAVQEWLQAQKYPYWGDINNGVFFILISK